MVCKQALFVLAIALVAFLGTTELARAGTLGAPAIPNAEAAIDPTGSMTLAQARSSLAFVPAANLSYPGTANAWRPLIVWIRFRPHPSLQTPLFLEVAPRVGRAELFYEPGVGSPYRSMAFGMRVPFARRQLQRVAPTIALPSFLASDPLYLRLALDDESHVVPLALLLTQQQIRDEDAATARLAAAALLFIGIFISLASANLFVFAFVRERSYTIYSGWMLANALFAATYMHGSAWAWFWPQASFPDAVTQGTVVLIEAIFLLAFARAFLGTRRLIPRADRIATVLCIALLFVSASLVFAFPSIHFFAGFDGRAAFLLGVVAFTVVIFALAVIALRAGSVPARFFVVSNALVSVAAGSVAIANLSSHNAADSSNFIALMVGQSLEGWLLFGALAFRLRQTTRAFSDEQQRRILAQAESLAQAHALLAQRELAATDALTGIPNRRSFDDTIEREWERCARARAPLSLLMIDIDHFKLFNDTYGHVLGDDCLRRVARAIAACATRPGDSTARYGGEEFAVVLPETDAEGAAGVARGILLGVRALEIEHRASSFGIVTISIGIATLVPVASDVPTIVALADSGLYRAKQDGRNRYVTAKVTRSAVR